MLPDKRQVVRTNYANWETDKQSARESGRASAIKASAALSFQPNSNLDQPDDDDEGPEDTRPIGRYSGLLRRPVAGPPGSGPARSRSRLPAG